MRRRTFALGLPSLLAAGPSMACPLAALQQSLATGTLTAVQRTYVDIVMAGAACEVEERVLAGRIAAIAHGLEAERMAARGAAPTEQLRFVDEGLRLGRPWRLLRRRGELLLRIRDAQGRIDAAAASEAFQAAMNDLNDVPDDPLPPSRREFERLKSLAEQSRMLATRLVPLPVTRGGEWGGLALRSVRGFDMPEIAQPIHFIWGSVEFADLGRSAADQLFNMLERERFPTVRLIGHTDPTGLEPQNVTLSRRRAARVRSYLEEKGYPLGRISTDGRGAAEPLVPAAEGVFPEGEWHQILRRVALVRL